MDRESPELIEKEMEQTRESLTEKVSLLENKVLGQVQSATDTVEGTMHEVQDTVQSVKAAVQDTVQSVTETVKHSVQSLTDGVKDALDLSRHTRANPWPMVGGAAVAGFLTGLVVFRKPATVSGSHLPAYAPMAAAGPAVSHRPGWLNDILEMAGREVKQIAQQAIAQASASVRETVQSRVPELVERVVPGGATAATGADGAACATGTGAAQFGGGMRR